MKFIIIMLFMAIAASAEIYHDGNEGNSGSDVVSCVPECAPGYACYWGKCVLGFGSSSFNHHSNIKKAFKHHGQNEVPFV